MSKYKVWSIEDIKQEIHKLEEKSNFYLDKDVEIRINSRLRRTLAWCVYKYENKLTKIDYIEFSKYLVDGSVFEGHVLDTIIHEFAHAYTDYNKPADQTRYANGHTEEWENNAIKLGGTGEKYYHGGEFTYKKPENNTLKIKCKKCGRIHDICEMVLGSEILEYYSCNKIINNKRCNGKFIVLQDIATDEKRLKCIKKYINKELTESRHGEIKIINGRKYRMCNIKNSSIMNLRMSYKNNLFKIQITNKLAKIKDEDNNTYETLINDVKKYLENKELFKFIDKLNFEHKSEDKYEFSFILDIENISLAEI
jgi:predicted small secreted protein